MSKKTDLMRVIMTLVENDVPFMCDRGNVHIKGLVSISIFNTNIEITKESARPFVHNLPESPTPLNVALWMVREYKAR